MKGPMGNLMRQAQRCRKICRKRRTKVAKAEVTGESGGGMVTMNGRHEVRRVEIDSSLIGDDKEMLEDLIAAACNDAAHRIDAHTKERMAGVTAGLNLPPGMKLPF